MARPRGLQNSAARRRDLSLSHDRWEPGPRLSELFEGRPPRRLNTAQRRAIVRLVLEGGFENPEVRSAVRRVMDGELDVRLSPPDPDVVLWLRTGECTERLWEQMKAARDQLARR